jgi:alkanesulfonate monooxygenase SsuD/methylene tetrahydromethanopterin reductase-like flavin-dependent oxidoreductase (luciferase family)
VSRWPASLYVIVPPHSQTFGVGAPLPVGDYLARLRAHLEAAERLGADGAFVYDFAGAMDPWLAAFDVFLATATLSPVVAVRPHHESAEAVARRLADLYYRFGRPAHVNLVAGATTSARAADDGDRFAARERFAAYARQLRDEVTRRLGPVADPPRLLTPASSTPVPVAADCTLLMARPHRLLAEEVERVRREQGDTRIAILAGLVVRPTDEEAWRATADLYPPDRRQEIGQQLFRAQLVSSEHRAGYAIADAGLVHDGRLWFGAPARGMDAPKLVGSPAAVTQWLRSCADLGVTDLIVDLPPDPVEYESLGGVLGR